MPNEQDSLFEFEPYSGISDADLEDVFAKVDSLVNTLSTEIDIPEIPASAQAPAVIPEIKIPPASLPYRAAETGPLPRINASKPQQDFASSQSQVVQANGETASPGTASKQAAVSFQAPSNGEVSAGRQAKRAQEANASISRIPERFIEENEAKQRARQRLAARLRAREEREAALAREKLVQEATAAANKRHAEESSEQEKSDAGQGVAADTNNATKPEMLESVSEASAAENAANAAAPALQDLASQATQSNAAVSQDSEQAQRPKISRSQVIAAAVPEVVAEGEPFAAAFGPRTPRVSETAVTAAIPVVQADESVKGSGVDPDATAEMDPIYANPSRMAVATRSKRRITKGKIVGIIVAIIAIALILFGSFFVWNRWYRYDDAADMQGEWQVANSNRTLVFTDSVMKISDDVDYEYTIDTSKKIITYTFGDAVGTASYRFSPDRKTLIIDEDNTDTDWLMAMGFKTDEAMEGSDVPDGITKLQKRSSNTDAEPQNLATGSADGEESDEAETSTVPGYTEYTKPSLTNDKSKESSDGESDDGEDDEDADYAYKDEETGTEYYYDSTQMLYYDQYGNYYYDMYGNNPYTLTTYSYTDTSYDTSYDSTSYTDPYGTTDYGTTYSDGGGY